MRQESRVEWCVGAAVDVAERHPDRDGALPAGAGSGPAELTIRGTGVAGLRDDHPPLPALEAAAAIIHDTYLRGSVEPRLPLRSDEVKLDPSTDPPRRWWRSARVLPDLDSSTSR